MKKTCFNDCSAPVVTKINGAWVCEQCADHYMGWDKEPAEKPEYITSDVATDLRGF